MKVITTSDSILAQFRELQASLDEEIQHNEAFLAKFRVDKPANSLSGLRTRPETRVEA